MGGSCCSNNHDFVDKQRWELEIIDSSHWMEEHARIWWWLADGTKVPHNNG